jgi:hypothetical protein
VQDANLHVIYRKIKSLLGPGGHEFIQPAFGLVTVSQAMMGQGQEGKRPGVAPITPDLNALVETADGFLELAGAIQYRPESL